MTDPIFDMSKKDKTENQQETFKGGEWNELFRTAIIALLIAAVVRSFLFEPFNIPSGSMLPNLKVGDYLFVSKYSYGYSKHSFPFSAVPISGRFFAEEKLPKRGDVVVFKLPTNTRIDYIKRIVGLPGDVIQVIKGRLYINGERTERTYLGLLDYEKKIAPFLTQTIEMKQYIQKLPNGVSFAIYEENDYGPLDNTPAFKVPEGHYFFMGDNRDNSQDSRVEAYVGFVPFENFVGRAERIFFSIDETAQFYNPLSWLSAIRYDRLMMKINNKDHMVDGA